MIRGLLFSDHLKKEGAIVDARKHLTLNEKRSYNLLEAVMKLNSKVSSHLGCC